MSETILNQLLEAQMQSYMAHTNQIVDLVTRYGYTDYDEAIKKLLDERRNVYNQFAKRINTYEASKSQ